jgi:hypothetical protein
MKTATLVVGILLLVLGLVTLAYEGYITFSSSSSTVSALDGQSSTKTTLPLRPIAAVLSAVSGFILILVSNKRSART